MYTGTLITELMATVERAEQSVQQIAVDQELHEIFSMQIAVTQGERVLTGQALMGAA
jgi:hypothetical protein